MLFLSMLLYLAVSAGLLAMAVKYGIGAIPAPHHAAAIGRDGLAAGPGLRAVLTGLYSALTGAYLGLAVLIAFLAVGPLRDGTPGVAPALLVAGVCAGIPAAYRTWRLSRSMGVDAPWRMATALTGLTIVASLIALF